MGRPYFFFATLLRKTSIVSISLATRTSLDTRIAMKSPFWRTSSIKSDLLYEVFVLNVVFAFIKMVITFVADFSLSDVIINL